MSGRKHVTVASSDSKGSLPQWSQRHEPNCTITRTTDDLYSSRFEINHVRSNGLAKSRCAQLVAKRSRGDSVTQLPA